MSLKAVTSSGGGGGVATVTATLPIASSGGANPNISIPSTTGTGNTVVLSVSPTLTGTTTLANFNWSGSATYSAATATIVANTADGSDNKRLIICGGGDSDATRGSYVLVSGNENGSGGQLRLVIGGTASLSIQGTGGETVSVTSAGVISAVNLAGTGTRLVTSTAGGTLGNATTIAGVYFFSDDLSAQSLQGGFDGTNYAITATTGSGVAELGFFNNGSAAPQQAAPTAPPTSPGANAVTANATFQSQFDALMNSVNEIRNGLLAYNQLSS